VQEQSIGSYFDFYAPEIKSWFIYQLFQPNTTNPRDGGTLGQPPSQRKVGCTKLKSGQRMFKRIIG